MSRSHKPQSVLMKAAWLAVSATALCFSAHAESPKQFDLVCTGVTTESEPRLAGVTPFSARYSIDLEAGQYCPERDRRCKAPLPIKAVEPDRIILNQDWKVPDTRHGRLREGSELVVNRADGSLRMRLVVLGVSDMTTEASCVPEAFTPLPVTMF